MQVDILGAPSPILLFWAGWAACAFALVVFIKAWRRGIRRNVYTYPFEIFSFFYFLVAPALSVLTDTYVDRTWFMDDPVRWLGWLNWLNAVGLLLAALATKAVPTRPPDKTKHVSTPIGNIPLLLATGVAMAVILAAYNLSVSANFRVDASDRVQASIFRYIFIETGPILFAWLVTIYAIRTQRRLDPLAGNLLLVVMLFLCVALNFSRGERVGVILNALIGLQLFHLYVVRLTKLHLLILGMVGLFAMSIVTLYKKGGVEGVQGYLEGRTLADYQQQSTDPTFVVIGDVGRADVQAPILALHYYDMLKPVGGVTYLRALTLYFPKESNPFPISWKKTYVGATAHLAADSNQRLLHNSQSGREESRIYGIVGEAILNFGILGALPAFMFLGFFSRWSLLMAVREGGWEKALFAPLIALTPLFLLFYDFDNIIFRLTMTAGFPTILLLANRLLQRRRFKRWQ